MHVIHLFIHFHRLEIAMQCIFRYYSEIAFAYFFRIFCLEIGFTCIADHFEGVLIQISLGLNMPLRACMILPELIYVHRPS